MLTGCEGLLDVDGLRFDLGQSTGSGAATGSAGHGGAAGGGAQGGGGGATGGSTAGGSGPEACDDTPIPGVGASFPQAGICHRLFGSDGPPSDWTSDEIGAMELDCVTDGDGKREQVVTVADSYRLSWAESRGWQIRRWNDMIAAPEDNLASNGEPAAEHQTELLFNPFWAYQDQLWRGAVEGGLSDDTASIEVFDCRPALVRIETSVLFGTALWMRSTYTVFPTGRIAIQSHLGTSGGALLLEQVRYDYVAVNHTYGAEWTNDGCTSPCPQSRAAWFRRSIPSARTSQFIVIKHEQADPFEFSDGSFARYWQAGGITTPPEFSRTAELQVEPSPLGFPSIPVGYQAPIEDALDPGPLEVLSGGDAGDPDYWPGEGVYVLNATAATVTFEIAPPGGFGIRHRPVFLVTNWTYQTWELKLGQLVVAGSADRLTQHGAGFFGGPEARLFLVSFDDIGTSAETTFTLQGL